MVDGFVGTVETERLNDSLWVLKLVGEHDLSTAPAVAGAFRRIADSCTNVVVDLTDTSFIDSTVVGALIGYADDGETVLLVAPADGAARRVLDLVEVTPHLRTFDTRDEALRAVLPSSDSNEFHSGSIATFRE
jgi:anti-anti-sigma factor